MTNARPSWRWGRPAEDAIPRAMRSATGPSHLCAARLAAAAKLDLPLNEVLPGFQAASAKPRPTAQGSTRRSETLEIYRAPVIGWDLFQQTVGPARQVPRISTSPVSSPA